MSRLDEQYERFLNYAFNTKVLHCWTNIGFIFAWLPSSKSHFFLFAIICNEMEKACVSVGDYRFLGQLMETEGSWT